MGDPSHPPADAPFALMVETGGDTFLVAPPTPELSWKLPAGVREQRSFELEARIGDESLRFHRHGPSHRFVPWPWRELESRARVLWRVRVHHDAGATTWSDWSGFETGLFEPDWSSDWIASPEGADVPVGSRPAYEFSQAFVVDEAVETARLYSAALGVYEVFVNDRRVGAAELMPGSVSYDRTLYAQAIDVISVLQPGENRITAVLSDGWYRGRTGTFRTQAAWGPTTAFRAEVHLDTASGTRIVAATDHEWDVFETEILKADLMDGQTTDLRRGPRPIGKATAGPSDVPSVSWSPAPPVRVTAEIPPRSVTRVAPDAFVVDFGQNASGRARLRSLGEVGERTTLVFGEHLDPDGDVTLAHLDAPTPDGGSVPFKQQDEVISDGGGTSVFEPHHTVHGFQFVRVQREGLELDLTDITMEVLHTDLRPVGGFTSSDADLNRLWEVASWSFRGNAVDVPTDCPTRERAGWTGDWQIFLPTAVRLYDVDGFSRKWLQSVRDDQLDDGRIVNVSPDNARLRLVPDPMSDMATGSAGWGDAIVLVPWELYRTYGDSRVLTDSWDAMTRWVAFALRSAAGARHPSRIARSADPLPHEQYIWDGTFHFGEWLEPTPVGDDGTPGPTMPDPMAWAMADKGEVGTAYLYRSVATLAQIARALGRGDDAGAYASLAEEIRDAWRIEFIDGDGRTRGNTQASYVRALAFDLAPTGLRDRVAQHLVDLIDDAGSHLGTGFLSTADLLPVLADTGHADVAHQLLWQRTTPSWLGMLDRGATTIWEEWEGVDRNGNAHASLNHYSKGAVIRYLHSHILGLRPADTAVAWDSFVVAPVVPPGVQWAKGHFDSPQGLIEVEWNDCDDEAVLRVVVPGGAVATIHWGDRRIDVGPGTHEVRTAGRLATASAHD